MISEHNKTIIYIGGFELPDKNAAAQRVMSNAKILRDLGWDVIFIGINKSLADNINIRDTESRYEGFLFYSVPYPKGKREWLNYLAKISYLDFISEFNPSLLIAYNYPSITLYKLLRWARKLDIKLIADCTEWYQPDGNFFFKVIKGLDVYFRMKIIQPKMDGLIVISQFLYNYYKHQNNNVLLLPPLIDKTEKKWQFSYKNRMSEQINLIYAGSPGSKDRLDIVIKSLYEIRKDNLISVRFIVIGITYSQFLSEYGHFSFDIEDFVEFKGLMPHKQVISLINESDFQIFIREKKLSNMAGFPTKFVEAISAGTPVLTNDTSDLKKYLIQDKYGFLLDISTQESLIKTLRIPLSLSKIKINEMKKICFDSNIFQYSNYISDFNVFLTGLNISFNKRTK